MFFKMFEACCTLLWAARSPWGGIKLNTFCLCQTTFPQWFLSHCSVTTQANPTKNNSFAEIYLNVTCSWVHLLLTLYRRELSSKGIVGTDSDSGSPLLSVSFTSPTIWPCFMSFSIFELFGLRATAHLGLLPRMHSFLLTHNWNKLGWLPYFQRSP